MQIPFRALGKKFNVYKIFTMGMANWPNPESRSWSLGILANRSLVCVSLKSWRRRSSPSPNILAAPLLALSFSPSRFKLLERLVRHEDLAT